MSFLVDYFTSPEADARRATNARAVERPPAPVPPDVPCTRCGGPTALAPAFRLLECSTCGHLEPLSLKRTVALLDHFHAGTPWWSGEVATIAVQYRA